MDYEPTTLAERVKCAIVTGLSTLAVAVMIGVIFGLYLRP